MKTATVRELKQELKDLTQPELVELCLRMAKFKKDNKELLTYLLFEAHNEAQYIEHVKLEIDELFKTMNTSSFYYVKKSIRKILRTLKKYIQYSKKKETEVELLIYFCSKLYHMRPSIRRSTVMMNLYHRQIDSIEKSIAKLHEDLQYDYKIELEQIENP